AIADRSIESTPDRVVQLVLPVANRDPLERASVNGFHHAREGYARTLCLRIGPAARDVCLRARHTERLRVGAESSLVHELVPLLAGAVERRAQRLADPDRLSEIVLAHTREDGIYSVAGRIVE